jgi:hypothetical protein
MFQRSSVREGEPGPVNGASISTGWDTSPPEASSPPGDDICGCKAGIPSGNINTSPRAIPSSVNASPELSLPALNAVIIRVGIQRMTNHFERLTCLYPLSDVLIGFSCTTQSEFFNDTVIGVNVGACRPV